MKILAVVTPLLLLAVRAVDPGDLYQKFELKKLYDGLKTSKELTGVLR